MPYWFVLRLERAGIYESPQVLRSTQVTQPRVPHSVATSSFFPQTRGSQAVARMHPLEFVHIVLEM